MKEYCRRADYDYSSGVNGNVAAVRIRSHIQTGNLYYDLNGGLGTELFVSASLENDVACVWLLSGEYTRITSRSH